MYAASGLVATTTERGTWVAPANRVTWTPPRFEHSHRFYGSTDVRVVMIPAELCAALVTHPSVFTVSPQLREALLALTDRKDRRAEMNDRPRAVTDLLRADFGQSTSLTELGRGAGASARTLSRLFREELGMSFQRWRTLLRIHHALIHLTNGRSVTNTAIECGWSNPTSFIDAFNGVVGQTPGRYQAALDA